MNYLFIDHHDITEILLKVALSTIKYQSIYRICFIDKIYDLLIDSIIYYLFIEYVLLTEFMNY
jgi:hypothetical protein